MTRVIGVVSGKGGVGKTTVVSNLGVALAQEGYDVIALDADVTGANLGLHFGLTFYPHSLHEVVKEGIPFQKSVYNYMDHLDIVPASLSMEHIELDADGLKDVLLNTHLMDKDFALIDVSTGLSSESKAAIEASSELILVTNPELPTLSDALRTRELARRYEKRFTGAILNRVKEEDIKKSRNVSNFLDLPVIGMLCEDYRVKESINAKVPIVIRHPDSWNSVEFRNIALNVLGKDRSKKAKLFEQARYLINVKIK